MGQNGLFELRVRQNEQHNKQRMHENRVNLVKFKACSVSDEVCRASVVHPDVVRAPSERSQIGDLIAKKARVCLSRSGLSAKARNN